MRKIEIIGLYLLSIFCIYLFFYLLGQKKDIGLEFSGKIESISYAPFAKDESPFELDKGLKISNERLDTDLALIAKKSDAIRTYSVTGLEAIAEYAKKYNLKLYLGAWVNADVNATNKELKKLIEIAKNNPDVIKAVIIGNETLLRREISGEQLAKYIKFVKSELPNIPVTYADVWEFWLKNPNLANEVDFITIHILPYWEDDPIPVKDSIEHIKRILSEVKNKMPNKEILIGESGYPSFGRAREDVVPSLQNQALYIRSFLKAAKEEGWRYNLIEAFDQPWKRISEGAVGGYWGIFDADRIDKGVLDKEVSNLPNYKSLFFVAAILILSTLIFIKELIKRSSKDLFSFFIIAIVGSILFALQLNQVIHTSRHIYEHIWMGLMLFVMLGIYIQSLRSIASNILFIHNPAISAFSSLNSFFRALFIFILLACAIGLAFDGRYREFDVYLFGFGLFVYLFFAKNGKSDGYLLERLASLVLSLCAITIFINESYLNFYSNIFVLILLLFAYLLWQSPSSISLLFFSRYGLVFLFSLLFFSYVRYGILNADEYILICEQNPKELMCQIRSTLGIIIHFNLFGILSILLTILSFFIKYQTLKSIALGFCVAALMLYNSSLGAIGLALALFAISYDIERIRDKKEYYLD